MNYDKRIKDYHEIRCFASRNNRECLGKAGYFAEDISELKNLDDCVKGICCFKDGEDFPFYMFEKNKEPTYPKKAYPIFCPASITKEKKYRPFKHINELQECGLKAGKVITVRHNNYPEVIRSVIVSEVNYNPETLEVINITLGATGYEFATLFNSYLFQVNCEWKPFGVEE